MDKPACSMELRTSELLPDTDLLKLHPGQNRSANRPSMEMVRAARCREMLAQTSDCWRIRLMGAPVLWSAGAPSRKSGLSASKPMSRTDLIHLLPAIIG